VYTNTCSFDLQVWGWNVKWGVKLTLGLFFYSCDNKHTITMLYMY
jgi:hypothetical protein